MLKKKVEILIENNVIGNSNFKKFNLNPFLMTNLEDTRLIMENTPKNVNLLLDLGHLKVSSNILKFDKFEMLEECKKWTKAYHLSENNGFEDQNLKIKKNSWFLKRMKKVKFYSLEVYSDNFNIIHQQINLLKKFI